MQISLIQSAAFDVSAVQDELAKYPEEWNTIKHRTWHPRSPHREVDDIWVRYNPIENFDGDMEAFNDVHTSEWYPVVDKLRAVKQMAQNVAEYLNASSIGAVLLTRIPVGCQVYPHVDGGWHARTFEKFAVLIAGNREQAFCFEDEELRSDPGDLWWFNNSRPHWVINSSAVDRISLIVCVRRP